VSDKTQEETKVVETLTTEQYEEQKALETKLNDIAAASTIRGSGAVQALKFTRATKVTRQDVVNAFTNAFQMIGGVDRLALWADANPGEFYKLFGKLMPPANSGLLDGNREFIVRHILPAPNIRTGPREQEPVDAEFEEVERGQVRQ
jgi:hypothetical protein